MRENKIVYLHVASSRQRSYDLWLLTTSHLEKNEMMKISKIETSINNSKDNTQTFYRQPRMRWNWNFWTLKLPSIWTKRIQSHYLYSQYQFSNNPFPSFTPQFSSDRSYHLWVSIFPPKDGILVVWQSGVNMTWTWNPRYAQDKPYRRFGKLPQRQNIERVKFKFSQKVFLRKKKKHKLL